MKRFLVGVIGDGGVAPNDEGYKIALELGRILVDRRYRILSGGLGGIMEAVSRGARSSEAYVEGDIVGILPSSDHDASNMCVDIPIATGMGLARNYIVANSHALIAIGGGAGTLSEIALGWQLGKLIIALKIEGWSGKLADTRLDDRSRHPRIPKDRIMGANNAKEAVELLDTWIPRYMNTNRT